MKKLIILAILVAPIFLKAQQCEKWKVFEISLKGDQTGNPFIDVNLSAQFSFGNEVKSISGFYDGNGIYKIRFSPDMEGNWEYITQSNQKKLDGKKGKFVCVSPKKDNHGPVVVQDTFYFAYSDGKPHYSFGTTCYAWVHQGDSMANLTLKTLANGYFNKIRFCVFPKDYDWNKNEPLLYPFEGKPLKKWDYTRFNPAYFRNIEKRIQQLDSLGIEADLIVFHPYDRWGFANMDAQTDERYIKYITSRFSAYKNVWWSMANEYDFMKDKKMSDWDKFISLFAANDPYNHLRGIHNGAVWYDHTNPLITHASIQSEDTYRAKDLRDKYKKPVVFDECRYEGNIPWSWGNLTPQEMVNKFWRGFLNGGFVGHGETYITENIAKWPNESNDNLWWSKGGILRGQSFERIKFLKTIIESSPGFLKPVTILESWMPYQGVCFKDEYYLLYYNLDQPRSQVDNLPQHSKYKIEVIDAWDMTIKPFAGEFSGKTLVALPQKPFTALRITKIKN